MFARTIKLTLALLKLHQFSILRLPETCRHYNLKPNHSP